MPFLLAALIAAASPLTAPSPDDLATVSWPADIDLSAGTDVDEDYRRQFALCDASGGFRGHAPYGGHACQGDPNRVTVLRRLDDGAIAFSAKLAVDLDGSAFACGPDHGRSDQCPTSLMLPTPGGGEVPVDSDAIPYVVIPAAGPDDVRGEFSRLTCVHTGDFGVVVHHGRVVPVIVADTGPFALLGEGSIALHRALGRELCTAHDAHRRCSAVVEPMESIEGEVTTILFPGSARGDLTPATIAATVRSEGLRLWRASRVSQTLRTATGRTTATRSATKG